MTKAKKTIIYDKIGKPCDFCGIESFVHIHHVGTLPKDFVHMPANRYLSKCCSELVEATHGCDSDFGHKRECDCDKFAVTWWDVCTKCKYPCDVYCSTCDPKNEGGGCGGHSVSLKSNFLCGKCEQEAGKFPNGERLPKHLASCPKREVPCKCMMCKECKKRIKKETIINTVHTCPGCGYETENGEEYKEHFIECALGIKGVVEEKIDYTKTPHEITKMVNENLWDMIDGEEDKQGWEKYLNKANTVKMGLDMAINGMDRAQNTHTFYGFTKENFFEILRQVEKEAIKKGWIKGATVQFDALVDNPSKGCVNKLYSQEYLDSKIKEAEERSREALQRVAEIYIGMDGIKPETAPEAYQEWVLKDMYNQITEELNNLK